MRVALVSPYSWTYPGGVTRHIEALARRAASPPGHDVRVLAPYDHDDRRDGAAAPRRAAAARASRPSGSSRSARRSAGRRTAPSRTSRGTPARGRARCGASCAPGGFDVVHLHEPVAPVIGWDALTSTDAPLVGTFHCYSESRAAARGRRAAGRAPQAQPPRACGSPSPRPPPGPAGASTAASTGSSPTASRCPPAACPRRALRAPGEPLRDRLRRPGGRAQGPAGAAARVRGAARARARAS